MLYFSRIFLNCARMKRLVQKVKIEMNSSLKIDENPSKTFYFWSIFEDFNKEKLSGGPILLKMLHEFRPILFKLFVLVEDHHFYHQ